MSSSLDVSLDSLIEAKVRSGRSGRGGGRGGGRGDRKPYAGRGAPIKVSDQFKRSREVAPASAPFTVTNTRVAAYAGGAQVRRAEQMQSLRQEKPRPSYQEKSRAPLPVAASVGSGIGSGSIFDRLGNNAASGTSVTIQKLNKDILPSDVSELCLTIGEVKSVNMQYDSAGKGTDRT